MQLKLDMSCHLLNVYTKFQIDISKHVEEKSGKHGRTDGRTDYFKKNCTYLVYLCLREQVGDTTVSGCPQFECNLNVFTDMILQYSSHCIDMAASREPINGVTATWLSCFATCNWLRALVHLHCDVIITTSMTKTWSSCQSLWSTCHAYERKFAIKIQC